MVDAGRKVRHNQDCTDYFSRRHCKAAADYMAAAVVVGKVVVVGKASVEVGTESAFLERLLLGMAATQSNHRCRIPYYMVSLVSHKVHELFPYRHFADSGRFCPHR